MDPAFRRGMGAKDAHLKIPVFRREVGAQDARLRIELALEYVRCSSIRGLSVAPEGPGLLIQIRVVASYSVGSYRVPYRAVISV